MVCHLPGRQDALHLVTHPILGGGMEGGRTSTCEADAFGTTRGEMMCHALLCPFPRPAGEADGISHDPLVGRRCRDPTPAEILGTPKRGQSVPV